MHVQLMMQVSPTRAHPAGYATLAGGLACIAVLVAVAVLRSGGATPHPTRHASVTMARGERVIPLPGPPASLALGAGSLWIPTSGEVVRLNPKTGRVVARIPLPAAGESSLVATTLSAIWVAPASNHTVVRIDPRSNSVVKTFRVGFYPLALRVAARQVLVISVTGLATPINPTTNTVGRPVPAARYGDSRLAHAVAKVNGYTGVLARGRAWVVTWGPDRHHPDPGTISMLDPRTGRLLETRRVGGTPTAVAVGHGAAWVTNFADNTLTRIPLDDS